MRTTISNACIDCGGPTHHKLSVRCIPCRHRKHLATMRLRMRAERERLRNKEPTPTYDPSDVSVYYPSIDRARQGDREDCVRYLSCLDIASHRGRSAIGCAACERYQAAPASRAEGSYGTVSSIAWCREEA